MSIWTYLQGKEMGNLNPERLLVAPSRRAMCQRCNRVECKCDEYARSGHQHNCGFLDGFWGILSQIGVADGEKCVAPVLLASIEARRTGACVTPRTKRS